MVKQAAVGALLALFLLLAVACGAAATSMPTPTGSSPKSTLTSTPVSKSPGKLLTLDDVASLGESPYVSGRGQMQPGQEDQYTVGILECCYFFVEVDAHVTWSVDPTSGASIDPNTGVFSVDATTHSGTTFRVTADLEMGRYILSKDVHVFTPEADPLVGDWQEEGTGNINELIFGAGGDFSVTWIPFEIRKDYWGTYTFDVDTGALELTVTGGNTMAVDFDGKGFFPSKMRCCTSPTSVWEHLMRIQAPRSQTAAIASGKWSPRLLPKAQHRRSHQIS